MFVQLTKAFLGKPAGAREKGDCPSILKGTVPFFTGERIDVFEEYAKSLVAQLLAVPVTDDLITPAVSKA